LSITSLLRPWKEDLNVTGVTTFEVFLCLETNASSAPMAFVSQQRELVNTKGYHYQHTYENWKY
jgi:hypothetical protein